MLLFALGVGVLAAATAEPVKGGGPGPGGFATIGFLLLVGGLAAFVEVRLLFRGEPVLRVDEEGVVVRGGLVSPGRIPWAEIERFEVVRRTGFRTGPSEFLLVHLRRPERFLARRKPAARVLLRLTSVFLGTPVALPARGLPVTPYEALRRIREYRRRLEAQAPR